jgi:hypothetical protein
MDGTGLDVRLWRAITIFEKNGLQGITNKR